ncbi:ABC transporter ATP-binding protein/permease [Granulicatella adiacens ATCC 49175]|uniref:ABC transporter, ATP-binding protein n=1 Tax=Granulicatella adiacens ATCC 49175 TaxID=638301 RepID=C8NGN1_9LACT|nr:tetracycline efflux ABC transporter Tet(60) subunit A [Granulicatella adiacens]EEW36858.1 ABC transporter, ATP-binding protein [Granulicatella adiacens ATCC 49175]UAK94166.1 ABC transporter ATP-binding protein/permease [Granulicatella adiacens]UWP38597.1 ABC transporter ATP-binding protein/permease [Granulicatella adiacens ATCC 49175]
MNDLIKLVIGFIKKHPMRYLVSFVLMVASSIAAVYPARIVGQVVDKIVASELNGDWLWTQLVILVGIILVAYITESIWTNLIFMGYYEMQKELRVKLLQNNLMKKIPFYAHFRTGDIITRSSEDVMTIGDMMGFGMFALMNSTLMVTVSIYMMVTTISLPLTIVAVLPLPILSYLVYKWGFDLEEEYNKAQNAVSQLNNEVLEMIDGTYVIRAYGQEDAMMDEFRAKTKKAMKQNIIVSEIESRFIPLAQLFMMISFTIALLYGGYLVSTGTILVGDVIAFQVYMGAIMWPMFMIGDIITNYKRGKVATERINEILRYDDDIERGGTKALETIESIEFKDFHFTYPGEEASLLKGINLTLKKGETLGIVGKTGSGKTTLLMQLLHQFPYKGEKLFINAEPLIDYDSQTVAGHLAYVPQEHTLFSRTIRENMLFGKEDATDDEIWEALTLASFEGDVKRMPDELDTMVGEKGVSLSGGQKQRLSIARAFLRNRECLILDDALSAVDAKTEREIISHLQQERGGCMNIISAHRLSAIRHADEIIVMNEGRISERGTHEELLEQRGWYYEQYLTQEMEEEIE